MTGIYTQAEPSLWDQDIRIDLPQFWFFADNDSTWTTFLDWGLSCKSTGRGRAQPPSTKTQILALLVSNLTDQCLVVNQNQVMQKDKNSWVYAASIDSTSGHELCPLAVVLVAVS